MTDTSNAKVFVGDQEGPSGCVGFFEDDGETGYLYVSDRSNGKITRHLHLYDGSHHLNITESDVQVLWSRDGNKCGVRIWGGMRGIIDTTRGESLVSRLDRPDSEAICDRAWLEGFPD